MKGQYGSEVGFNPEKRTFSGYNTIVDAVYAEMDIEVTPYLMPTQNVKCQKHISIKGSDLYIEATDMSGNMETPRGVKVNENVRILGFPFMDDISLDGNNYKLNRDTYTGWVFFDDKGENVGIVLHTLSLSDRIDNLQIKVEVQDVSGNHIPTTTLPYISLQRGYITTMRGLLFSGSTSDWTVTVEPYID